MTAALGFLSIGWLFACSSAASDDTGDTPLGGATASGGAPHAGGTHAGSGGSAVAMGGKPPAGLAGATSSGGSLAATSGTGGGEAQGGSSGGTNPSSGRAGNESGAGGDARAGSGGTAGAASGGRGGTSGGRGGASSSGSGQGGAPSGCKGEKVVHFVYFVEGDQTFDEDQRKDIEKQAFAFQNYWFQQLGVTFYLNEPVVDVIEGDQPASWYLNNPDGIHSDSRWYRLGNMKNEVYRKLGIRNFDPNHRVVNYPTTRHDGRVGGNFGGAWMDGDDMTCIATNGVNFPYNDGNSAHCLGHVAHEFGHVLGLDHEGPQNDCMQFGFYVSPGGAMCNFSAANIAKIKSDADNAGWLEAMPGQTCVGIE